MAAIPVLKTIDLDRALAFYTERLGATVNWVYAGAENQTDPGYASLTLLESEIHLSSFGGDGAFGTTVYFNVPNVDALYAEWVQNGVDRVELLPVDQTWGQREFYLRDLDNNCLRVGMAID